jgi:hypothetical protein
VKRLGKLVIMTETEFAARARDNTNVLAKLILARNDAEAAAGDLAEELSRAYAKVALVEENRRKERKAAFTAGKFHASGGYAHALKELRLKLQGTTAVMMRFMDLAAKWRPLVEALETYPNQFVEIGFDAGLHFPVKRFEKDGTEYLATVQYQEGQYPDHQAAATLRALAHADDVSDADAAADFDVVGVAVAQERRRA